jgi:ABC-type lipoprotein export system ATPase subunit
MIEVRDLAKSYSLKGQMVQAVKAASFSIEKGQMVSIIGHSGSGKTTLLSLMGGLTRPDSGTVSVKGVDLWAIDDDELSAFRNREMSFIYQFASLIPTLTAIENIMLPTAFGAYGHDIEARARDFLSQVGLKGKEGSYPSQLSGGQQRRVAIARAFINSPEIVLADEPTGDLDEETERDVMDLFEKMNSSTGATFVVVTHNRELASRMPRRMQMANGVIKDI